MCDTPAVFRLFRSALTLLALLLAGPVAAQRETVPALRALDGRIATVGFRLATAGAPFCQQVQWLPGFAIHDLSQYPASERANAAAFYRLTSDGPAVLALAEGGPAARAGLRLDDTLVSADGASLARVATGTRRSYAPLERIAEVLDHAFADGAADLDLLREGAPLRIHIEGVRGCASRFQVLPSRSLQSEADGLYVQITSAMANFARGDDELAAVLAHELAHNILRHRARLNAAGVQRGLLANFGRSGRRFRQTESEADRYSVYLLALAGYDIQAALRFWERLAQRVGGWSGTHPSWRERLAAIASEIETVARLQRSGAELRPPALDVPLR